MPRDYHQRLAPKKMTIRQSGAYRRWSGCPPPPRRPTRPAGTWCAGLPGDHPVQGQGAVLPADSHLVPEAAVEVEIVAVGLAGGAVADVGVQRVPVIGELTGAAGAAYR